MFETAIKKVPMKLVKGMKSLRDLIDLG